MRCFFEPYEGNEPFIFFSYCHNDAAVVYPMIERLILEGYRVWYDNGIHAGEEWPEVVASHLDAARVCVAAISAASSVSHNCKNELSFAVSNNKPFVSILLETFMMPLGMRLQLSSSYYIDRTEFSQEEQFYGKLLSAANIDACRNANVSADTEALRAWQRRAQAYRTEDQKPDEKKDFGQWFASAEHAGQIKDPVGRDEIAAPAAAVVRINDDRRAQEEEARRAREQEALRAREEAARRVQEEAARREREAALRRAQESDARSASDAQSELAAAEQKVRDCEAALREAAEAAQAKQAAVQQAAQLIEEKGRAVAACRGRAAELSIAAAEARDRIEPCRQAAREADAAAAEAEREAAGVCERLEAADLAAEEAEAHARAVRAEADAVRAEAEAAAERGAQARQQADAALAEAAAAERTAEQTQAACDAAEQEMLDARNALIEAEAHSDAALGDLQEARKREQTLSEALEAARALRDACIEESKRVSVAVSAHAAHKDSSDGAQKQAPADTTTAAVGSGQSQGIVSVPDDTAGTVGYGDDEPTVYAGKQVDLKKGGAARGTVRSAYLLRIGTRQLLRLNGYETRLGRSAAQADIVFENNTQISRSHAEIVQYQDAIFLFDKGSVNGTFVNGRRLGQQERVQLHDLDEITLGNEQLLFLSDDSAAWIAAHAGASFLRSVSTGELRLLTDSGMPLDRKHPWKGGELTDLHVRRRDNAEIIWQNGAFSLRDIESAHGTFLNGRRLTHGETVVLNPGDTITVVSTEFQYWKIQL